MDRVVPGSGGDVRPCEYFDIIGASGPNALCALLFVKFVRLTIYQLTMLFQSLIAYLYTVSDN